MKTVKWIATPLSSVVLYFGREGDYVRLEILPVSVVPCYRILVSSNVGELAETTCEIKDVLSETFGLLCSWCGTTPRPFLHDVAVGLCERAGAYG